VRAEGATGLFTSVVLGDAGPAGFYERFGFVPSGDLDVNNEVIVRLCAGLTQRPAHNAANLELRGDRAFDDGPRTLLRRLSSTPSLRAEPPVPGRRWAPS
jgi:hypothetical protein